MQIVKLNTNILENFTNYLNKNIRAKQDRNILNAITF